MNISPAHLHLEVSNANVYDIRASTYYVILSLLLLLKYLIFIMIMIVSALVI